MKIPARTTRMEARVVEGIFPAMKLSAQTVVRKMRAGPTTGRLGAV